MNTSRQSCQPSPTATDQARSPRASRRSWSALLIGGLLASGAAVGLSASAAPTVTGAIHGNEHTGVEAQLSLLQRLSTGSPAMEEILDGVTLVSIPLLHLDGLELNRRVNDISWADTLREFPQLRGAPRPGTTGPAPPPRARVPT